MKKSFFGAAFVAVCVLFLNHSAGAEESVLLFSPEEMAVAYRYHYNAGPRMNDPLQKRESGAYFGTVSGKEVWVPQRFIEGIKSHVVEMFQAGSAKYLFRLDLGHGHLYLPKHKADLYGHLPKEKFLESALEDTELAIVYHASEFLKSDDDSPQSVIDWKSKRNIIGRFDGRPIEIIRTDPPFTGARIPGEYVGIQMITLEAHRFGCFGIVVTKKNGDFVEDIQMDIALDFSTT